MNNLFIISGPSGAGEDSVIDGLEKYFPIERVITTTTRKTRQGESQGNPYYFISQEEFQKNIDNNKFFEYAREYNDNYYGVAKKEINRVINSRKTGIWKIEYKGVISAKKLFPGIIAIFLNAPLKTLEKRIRARGNITDEYVKERLDYTREWLKHKDIYDYEVINKQGKLEETIKKIVDIINKHKKL
ncbi:MAG: guanylate kinase [Patescibacteria group bacterium]|nr:guanylate kinase [Patescibacteria group bacterium]